MHMYMPSSLLHPSRDSLVYMEFPSSWVVPITRFLSINSSSLPTFLCFFLHRYFHRDRCLCFLMSLGIMAGFHHCASHKGIFNLETGCQKWKHLDTPGTQPPLNNAVIHVKCKQCTSGQIRHKVPISTSNVIQNS